MTAKRFTLVDDYKIGYDGDIFDLHKPSDIRSLVNVIGYVTDENEQLKSFNQDLSENLSVCADKRLAQGEHLTKLTNENEQLKERLKELGE